MKLTGFDKLAKALDELPKEVATNYGIRATRAAAKYIGKRVEQVVPKGTQSTKKTRRLKGRQLIDGRRKRQGEKVSYDYGRWHQNIRVRRDKRSENPGEISFMVTSGDAFWSWFYEKGTVDQPARPVIAPLFLSETDAMITLMANRLEKAIIRREKRIARLSALD
jgi:HK97 gp10 family phage protein